MKIKKGYVMQKVAGENVVIPTSDNLVLNKMITLNETGKFLWELLQKESTAEDLVQALTQEYEVDETTAKASVERFVEELKKNGFLDS